MKSIWQLLVTGLVVITCSTSCEKARHDFTPTSVKGQVFLVLKSGNAVKLALASISVVPEAEALAAADAAQKQCEATLGLANTDLEQEMSRLATQVTAEREALRRRQEQLSQEIETMRARRDFSEAYSAKVASLSSISDELESNDGLKEESEELRKNREGALRRYPNEFAAALIAAAKPTRVTRTNADGEFTIDIPKSNTRTALLIEASRELDRVERFVWFVWADQLTPDNGVYLFSNHNIATAPNEANVVTIPAIPPQT
jgi:hypothetical protein